MSRSVNDAMFYAKIGESAIRIIIIGDDYVVQHQSRSKMVFTIQAASPKIKAALAIYEQMHRRMLSLWEIEHGADEAQTLSEYLGSL